MKVLECKNINFEENTKVIFVRVEPENLKVTLSEIFMSLSNLSWLSRFDEIYTRESYKHRAEKTIEDIERKFKECSDDKLTSDAGEYVVSELARKAIVSELKYLDIPLAELLGKKISGNPGFDFHSENTEDNIILFGEAKYKSQENAYGTALSQICRFIDEKKDIVDLADLKIFCTPIGLENVLDDKKGFVAAFSATKISTEALIKNIKKNTNFKDLLKYNELIVVAVNI